MKPFAPVLIATLVLAGCGPVLRAPVPGGFAPFSDNSPARQVATSPDDVSWETRLLEDQPEAGLAFWKDALRRHLESHGHQVVDSFAMDWGGTPAGGYETRVALDDREIACLVVVSPKGTRIAVARATGLAKDFVRRREALVKSLAAIRLE